MQKEMRGINLSNLVWKIIFAWKKVMVVAVLAAAVLTTLKYVSDSDAASNSTTIELNAAQKVNANKLLELYDQLNYYEKYIDESFLMKVNPLCYDLIKLQYFVDSSYEIDIESGIENDYTAALVRAYSSYVTRDSFIDELKASLNIESENNYIRELFTVNYDITSSVVEIETIVPSGIDSEVMISTMKGLMQGKTGQLQEIGEHQLVEVNASIDETVSGTLVTQRNTIVKGLDAVKLSIETTKATLSLKELVYVDEHLEHEQYKGGYTLNMKDNVSIDVKYAVIGFILGAFCVIAYYCMVALFSNKLQDARDIRELYGIKLLGIVGTKKVKTGPVYSILQKIKNRNNKVYTYGEQIDKLVVGISLLCEQNNATKIFIAGSCLKNIDVKLIDDLKAALNNKNIEVSSNGKLGAEAAALNGASNADGIILVEKLEKSIYNQIEQEIIASKDYNLKLFGAVVVE